MNLKLVKLFGAANFYSLNKNELLKHDSISKYAQEESVLIDEETYNKLQKIPMIPIDDFKHLRFCKNDFSVRHYLVQHFTSWKQIDENTYSVGFLKKEHNF